MDVTSSYYNEVKASEIISADFQEHLTEEYSLSIKTRRAEGPLARIIRSRSHEHETTPVLITETEKETWDAEREEDYYSEYRLRIVCGQLAQEFVSSTYEENLTKLLFWLE